MGYAEMTGKVIEKFDRSQIILDALKYLKHSKVLVGVPQETSGRGGGVTNAELAYIHTHGVRTPGMRAEMAGDMQSGSPYSEAYGAYLMTHGSPAMGIPPRPFLEPAIQKHRDELGALLKQAAGAACEGNRAGVDIGLRKAGMLGQNVVRRYFVEDNGWPPNAPSTIAQKGSDRPLIDTGELRKSVAYVVVADGRREVGL